VGVDLRKAKRVFLQDEELTLIQADVSDGLDLVGDGTAQLIITSPPYNIGKAYERNVEMSLDQYLGWLAPIAEKLCTKLTECGSLCWQVGNFVQDRQVFRLDFYFYDMFTKLGLKLRNRII
jgi:adenine-specific DNA-methyltransferase